MNEKFFEQELYTKEDYAEKPLRVGEYDHCTFRDCNFAGSDISGCLFIDCSFRGCNLSNLKVTNASFQETRFQECKMLGFRFDECEQLGMTVRFDNCQLDHSSFYQVKLNHTVFKETSLQGVDFTEADLRNTILDRCDLLDASFDHSNLERANLSTALNYSIDPENNRVQGARFSLPAVVGLLDRYKIVIEEIPEHEEK